VELALYVFSEFGAVEKTIARKVPLSQQKNLYIFETARTMLSPEKRGDEEHESGAQPQSQFLSV
jgi:hypothetical protein